MRFIADTISDGRRVFHGQWLYVDPAAKVTIVRFSSQPIPVDDPVDLDCLRLFAAISERV